MVKLTRIVKKILVKGAPEPDAKKKESTTISAVESLATRGLPQPTVDFSNLPIIDDDELLLRSAQRERRKVLKSVKRKGLGIAKDKGKEPDFKSKVVLPKVKRTTISQGNVKQPPVLPLKVTEPSNDSGKLGTSESKPKEKGTKGKNSTKVIKSLAKTESRSKRKREARKEMWRRKYDFSNEAKRLIENFQKEDKHGKALGNLSGLQEEVTSLENLIGYGPPAGKSTGKQRRKEQLRNKMRNKALFKEAMDKV